MGPAVQRVTCCLGTQDAKGVLPALIGTHLLLTCLEGRGQLKGPCTYCRDQGGFLLPVCSWTQLWGLWTLWE